MVQKTASWTGMHRVQEALRDIRMLSNTRAKQGFDAGRASGVLMHLLQQRDMRQHKRCLVPGFGRWVGMMHFDHGHTNHQRRGYDLIEIARAGVAEVVGIEIAQSAITTAHEFLVKHASTDVQARITHTHGDFLAYNPAQKYDLGWEYTLLSALHPSMFPAWAAAWARAIAPGGVLVTLMFPVDPNHEGGGPPYPVTPELYKELLEGVGFMCIALERVDAKAGLSLPGREGREVLALWQRLTA